MNLGSHSPFLSLVEKISRTVAKPRSTFTVWEFVVAVLVAAILAALIVPKLLGSQRRGPNPAMSDEASLDTALKSFHLDCDRYPTTGEGLQALIDAPAKLKTLWHGPYLDKGVPLDPWGNPYVYESNGDKYTIISYGRDGRPGGTGDAAEIVDING